MGEPVHVLLFSVPDVSPDLTLATGLSKGPGHLPAEIDEPAGDPRPIRFLLTHGAGGSLATPGLKALGKALAQRGFLTIRFDLPYRAAGRKAPPKAEASVAGFTGAFEDAREQFGGGWVVGGRSYGGRVASMAVAGGLEAAGLLLYSYPLHRPGDASEPRVQHWPEIKVPTLFLEGTHDPFCDAETFERHLPELGGRAQVHQVAGGDHSLKVSKKNAPDGKAVSEAKVLESLAEAVEAWVAAAHLGG